MNCCPAWCRVTRPHVVHRDTMPVDPSTPRVEVVQLGIYSPEVVVTTYPAGQTTKTRYTPAAARAAGAGVRAAGAEDLGCWLIIAAAVADGVEEAAGLALLADLLTPGGAR